MENKSNHGVVLVGQQKVISSWNNISSNLNDVFLCLPHPYNINPRGVDARSKKYEHYCKQRPLLRQMKPNFHKYYGPVNDSYHNSANLLFSQNLSHSNNQATIGSNETNVGETNVSIIENPTKVATKTTTTVADSNVSIIGNPAKVMTKITTIVADSIISITGKSCRKCNIKLCDFIRK